MPELSRNDFKQIARWHGFEITIEKECDVLAKGRRRSYDFMYVTWEGAPVFYRLGWFWRLQSDYHTMKEVVELLEKKKRESE